VSSRRSGVSTSLLLLQDRDGTTTPARINSLLATKDSDRTEFCYILRSCSKRMVDKVRCTLGRNNFLDVKYFVPSVEHCKAHCQARSMTPN
jgi:hypothetical protein